jgi:hypothetical protein
MYSPFVGIGWVGGFARGETRGPSQGKSRNNSTVTFEPIQANLRSQQNAHRHGTLLFARKNKALAARGGLEHVTNVPRTNRMMSFPLLGG